MITISKNTGRILYTKNPATRWTVSRIGLFFSLLGAFLVSSTLAPFLGFAAFAVGAVCWIRFAFSVGNYELAALEAVFLCTNILGLFMWYDI